jgi:hypothetical protein
MSQPSDLGSFVTISSLESLVCSFNRAGLWRPASGSADEAGHASCNLFIDPKDRKILFGSAQQPE